MTSQGNYSPFQTKVKAGAERIQIRKRSQNLGKQFLVTIKARGLKPRQRPIKGSRKREHWKEQILYNKHTTLKFSEEFWYSLCIFEFRENGRHVTKNIFFLKNHNLCKNNVQLTKKLDKPEHATKKRGGLFVLKTKNSNREDTALTNIVTITQRKQSYTNASIFLLPHQKEWFSN